MPVRMTHVKMRSFIVPVAAARARVTLRPAENDDAVTAMLAAKTDERIVASARLELRRGSMRSARSRRRSVATQERDASRRRVAITGIGLVTPVGNDVGDDVDARSTARRAAWRRSRCSTHRVSRRASPPR